MPIRIVLVDDHAVLRSGLHALLDKEPDLEVVDQTGSGTNAIRITEEKPYDVLLLDISMPGLSGPRVAEEVLKRKPNIAIVVLTMHEDEHYLRELFQIGAKGFVLKRSTGDELVQAVRAVYRGDSYIDPAMANLLIKPYVGLPNMEDEGRLGILTQREREICQLLAYGHTNAETADKLNISVRTVETHRNNIMSKLDLRSRGDLVRFAIDNQLFQPE